ncbi:MAG: hypothetical protein IJ812_04720 [Schwartzia sp.]|nr:hypothetical protein [Schwartzia sp. (in: firmicutes)]
MGRASEVERIKQHKETKVEYMTLMMELNRQRREGREEGSIETMLKNIRALMEKKGWSLSEALDVLDVSPEDRLIVSAKL